MTGYLGDEYTVNFNTVNLNNHGSTYDLHEEESSDNYNKGYINGIFIYVP